MYVSRCDTLRTSLHLYNIMARNAQFRFNLREISDTPKTQEHSYLKGGRSENCIFKNGCFIKGFVFTEEGLFPNKNNASMSTFFFNVREVILSILYILGSVGVSGRSWKEKSKGNSLQIAQGHRE